MPTMFAGSQFLSKSSVGIVHVGHPKPSFTYRRYDELRFSRCNVAQLDSMRIRSGRVLDFHAKRLTRISYVSNNRPLNFDDSLHEEPLWLSLIKDAFRVTRSFFTFLVEQPSQLKYIEWPSFRSTLRTATLTLVLVALLIVALATVDSSLCYVLALFLRRKP